MVRGEYEDEDFPLHDDSDGIIIGYECLCCNHYQADKGFDSCERCCGPLDPIFE